MAAPTLILAAAAAPAGENPYGLMQALNEGGLISWTVFIILVAMSVFSFYILFTKLLQQQKIMSQANKVRASFWNSPTLREAAGKLEQLGEQDVEGEDRHRDQDDENGPRNQAAFLQSLEKAVGVIAGGGGGRGREDQGGSCHMFDFPIEFLAVS